jgi:hypothetical protein
MVLIMLVPLDSGLVENDHTSKHLKVLQDML